MPSLYIYIYIMRIYTPVEAHIVRTYEGRISLVYVRAHACERYRSQLRTSVGFNDIIAVQIIRTRARTMQSLCENIFISVLDDTWWGIMISIVINYSIIVKLVIIKIKCIVLTFVSIYQVFSKVLNVQNWVRFYRLDIPTITPKIY